MYRLFFILACAHILYSAPVTTGVWDSLDAIYWQHDSWNFGNFIPSDNREGTYTTFYGRSCLELNVVDSGNHVFLRTDWFTWPRNCAAYDTIELEIYAPRLDADYSIDFIVKNQWDGDEQKISDTVSATGWKTISLPLSATLSSNISLLWISIGGGVVTWDAPDLPTNQTFAVYVDKITLSGSPGTHIIDDFTQEDSWISHGSGWNLRPWRWYYSGGDHVQWCKDSSADPWAAAPERADNNCLVVAYDAAATAETEAKIEPEHDMGLDLSAVGGVQMDVWCEGAMPPLAFAFYDAQAVSNAYVRCDWHSVSSTSQWQTLTWQLPKAASLDFNWTNVEKMIIRIDTTDPAAVGTVFFDSIAFTEDAGPTASNQLFTSVSPLGAGTIIKSPDREWFATGEVVTLQAIPSGDYQFRYWSGDFYSGSPDIVLTMDAPYAVTARFGLSPQPGVWETFNTAYWADDAWSDAFFIPPASRQLWFTNVQGKSTVAYHLEDTGNHAFFRTDWTVFPTFWTNSTHMACRLYAPDLGSPYIIEYLLKTEDDADIAFTNITVDAAGWYDIPAPILYPTIDSIGCYWLILGGGVVDWQNCTMPTGQVATFYIDAFYATNMTTGTQIVVDDLEENHFWHSNGNWTTRPRDWRYLPGTDYVPWGTSSMEPLCPAPGSPGGDMSLIMLFHASEAGVDYAQIENNGDLALDAYLYEFIEADVYVTETNTPVRFGFYDPTAGGDAFQATEYTKPAAGSWQHIMLALPKTISGAFHWDDVEKVSCIVRTDTTQGDPVEGEVYVDNISFAIPEPMSSICCVILLTLIGRQFIRKQ